MMRTCGSLLWVFVLASGLARAREGDPTFHGSEAFRDFRIAGYEMVDERLTDLDGDGLIDAVVVEKSASGYGLSAWRSLSEGDFRFMFRCSPASANGVTTFKRIPLGPTDMAFVLDVIEDSPDEADHDVKIFVHEKEGLREIFHASYRVSHPEEDAGRDPRPMVDLGGLQVGFELTEVPGGWPLAVIRHDPKKIGLIGRQHQTTWFVIGIRERVFRADGGRYVEKQDRYINYLPRLDPKEVTATSTLPSSSDDWQARSAVDGQLETGWLEGRPDSGAGESITLSFEQPSDIRLIRLVPGCASSAASWEKHNRVGEFSLLFEGGILVQISRELGAGLDPLVEASEDFALPGMAFGNQTLVFLSKPLRSKWIKLTVEEARRGTGESDETCIAEISVHTAHIDVSARRSR